VALLDWIAVALIVVSMLFGLVRGLVFEVISLVGWVVAFVVAQWFASDVAAWLPAGDPQASWRYPLAFRAAVRGGRVRRGPGGRAHAQADRRRGIASGRPDPGRCLRRGPGAVALLVLAVVVHLLALSDSAWWHESRSAVVLDAALQSLKPALPEKLASYLP
jgi:membrane protein required for colicin V production